jgi:hypothetical protein
MLPTSQPMEPSRTKRARASKCFEEVRIGAVRLYFSHFESIGFQLDGALPAVRVPSSRPGVNLPIHVEQNRLCLEPDKTKWLSKHDFEMKWEEISNAVFQMNSMAPAMPA